MKGHEKITTVFYTPSNRYENGIADQQFANLLRKFPSLSQAAKSLPPFIGVYIAR